MRLNFVDFAGTRPFVAELFDALAFESSNLGMDFSRSGDVVDDGCTNVVDIAQLMSLHKGRLPDDEVLRRSIGLVLGRPGTHGFADVVGRCVLFGAVMAISEQSRDHLLTRGIKAELLQLGYSRHWDRSSDLTTERDIDVLTFGRHDDRRSRFLAGAAPYWWDVKTHHAISPADPWISTVPPSSACDLLGRARMVVNVHREITSGLEWLRAAMALSNGAVLVSEYSDAVSPLRPGDHLVVGSFEALPVIARGLMDIPGLLATYREASYSFVRTQLPLSAGVEALVRTAQRLQNGTSVAPASRLPEASPVPARKEVGWVQPRTGSEAMVGTLRRLERLTREHSRELTRLRLGLAGDQDPPRDVYETPSWRHALPRVSVIVPLFNYEHLVTCALETLTRCDGVDFEVLVQDDGSTDDSYVTVVKFLEEHSWLPARVERTPVNQGLPVTRNDLLRQARGEYVFNLDADNGVFPPALARLAAALDRDSGAAFAYSIISRVRDGNPESVMGWEEWDPSLFRYGNFIDAMAMARKDVLNRFGGWSTSMDVGWEDFHLWVRLAEQGFRGLHVPEILCWYRVSDTSMLASTLLETCTLWAEIRAAAPNLMVDDEAPA